VDTPKIEVGLKGYKKEINLGEEFKFQHNNQ
jgi:hypothetical protein